MTRLNKRFICSAIAALSTSASAELQLMDDAQLGATTGQAGLTVEINHLTSDIGALDYKDQGFISIKDITFRGGDFTSGIDNILLTLDVAGAGTNTDLGVSSLGAAYLSETGGSVTGLNEVDQNATLSDGDLVISLRRIDNTQGVDYGLKIGSVELGASTQTAGSVSGGTVVMEDFSMSGYLGPVDIVIDGQDGGLNLNAFFMGDGELKLPFIATSFKFSVHNSRGNSQVEASGATFAHVQVHLGRGKTADGKDALQFDIQDFSGDLDLLDMQLGDNGISIGDVYITDAQMRVNTVIYGH
jgi:hypothetical protein